MPKKGQEVAKQAPANQQQAPANQQQAPANQQQAPANQQQAPANQQQAPANQQQAPANQEQAPANQEQAPANQTQAAQTNDTQSANAQADNTNPDEEDSKDPKSEKKKKNHVGMPYGGGGLRLEHEYQVLFGGNDAAQESANQSQPAAKDKSGAKEQNVQEKEKTAADTKIQLLEQEIALLKAQMAQMQAEIQQLKTQVMPSAQTQTEMQSKQNEQPAATTSKEQKLLEYLRVLNGDKDVPEQVKNNLHQLLDESAKSRNTLKQALDSRKSGEMLYAGVLVPSIVAGKNIERFIMDSTTPDILNAIGDKDFVEQWKKMSLLSTDVRFASEYMHNKEFFEQSIFTKNGMRQLSRSMDHGLEKWDEYIQKGKDTELLFKESKIEAEKLAIEEGLVNSPEQEQQSKQNEQSPATTSKEQKLLEYLRVLNGDKDVPEQVKNNLHQLLDESAKSRNTLKQALDSRKSGEMLYAGDLVPSIVAGKNIEKFIMDSTTPDILNAIGDKDFVEQWKKMSLLSTDVRFASDYMHNKEFFEQSIFTKDGMRQLSRSMDHGLEKWDEYIQKGKDTEPLFTASKIDAEKLAIEAGLVNSPVQEELLKQNEEDLLRLLQKENKGKELPQSVKDNIHKVLTDGEKSRELLKNGVKAMKNGERVWAGDGTVESIVAADTLKQMIQNRGEPFATYVGGFDNFMGLLGGKDFAKGWKDLTGISENVRYTANFEHDKDFFKKNVLEPEGLQKMTKSVIDKFPTYLQKVAAKKDNELHKEAQKGAEYIAGQQQNAKPKQQPYTKPIVKRNIQSGGQAIV